MKLKIITPDCILLDRDVESVYAYSLEGRFGVLPNHTPMIAVLAIGVLCYFIEGKRHCVAVIGGYLQTDGEEVKVLSQAAELGEAIDVLRAEQARKQAEALLHAQQEGSEVPVAKLALVRSIARIKAAHGLFNP
jgi:F-type H+-transporting ATPase subunit epsilon